MAKLDRIAVYLTTRTLTAARGRHSEWMAITMSLDSSIHTSLPS